MTTFFFAPPAPASTLVPNPCFENALLPPPGCRFAGQPVPAALADTVAVSSLVSAVDVLFRSASVAWQDIFTGHVASNLGCHIFVISR